MLGELIIPEEKGKVVGTRILSVDELGSKTESTVQTNGTLLGEEFTTLLTVVSTQDPWGTYRLEGHGICTTRGGDQIRWKGFGVGWASGRGSGMIGRFTETWFTSSPKFARLNKILGVEEFEIDENGNTADRVWEWK